MLELTNAAREIVQRAQQEEGSPLLLVIGSGCCEGPAPQLYPDYGLPQLGELVYEEPMLRVCFMPPFTRQPGMLYRIDVEQGVINDTLSLEGKYDCRLTLHIEVSKTDFAER